MLGRMEFAVNRRDMLGLKIAALLRSTMAFDRDQAEGLEDEHFGSDPAMVPGLERTAPHVRRGCQRKSILSRLTFPARPHS
jgi:hypothetical protein